MQKTILLADNVPHTRNTLTLILGNADFFHMLTALNGREAIAVIIERHASWQPVDLLW